MDTSFAIPEARLEPITSSGEPGATDSAVPDDALLWAIRWLCQHHGITRSLQSLLDGQSLVGPLQPDQAVKALQSAGFHAELCKRDLPKMLSLLMPAVLLLRHGQVCVVVARMDGDGGSARYRIATPAGNGVMAVVSESDLLAEYAGQVILAGLRPESAGIKTEHVADSGHWLWSTLKRYLPYYRSAMLAALLSNVLMILTGLFTSVVYDRVIPHKAFVTLWSLGAGVLIAIVFDLTARQLRSFLIDAAGKKADLVLGRLIFRQALSIQLEHRPESAGAFAHRLTQIEIVRDFSTSATISALTDVPFILLFIIVTWLVAGELVLVLLIAVPLVLLLTWAVQSMLRRQMSANMAQQADLHGVLIEAVEGLEDVRASGSQGHFMARYESLNAQAAMSSLRARTLSSWINNFAMVSQQLITVAMLLWGVHLIDAGHLTGGALIAAVMFGGRAIAPLGSVVGLASRYQSAKAALRSLEQLMTLPTERVPYRQYLPQQQLTGQLALRDVRFSYPQVGATHAAPTVLHGVSLSIRAGERVAILGKIGSGKSTILRMLGGLYQPTEGFVEVDGIDLRQIDPADFRTHIGFVSQEPRLFQGSLRDNVLLGRANADAARFLDVARQTGLDRVAAAHPLGYDLQVGEGGYLLSGGQRQLVALARCLVTQPQVLLLDEPTSSMDAQAESSFIQHLKSAVASRTLVVVTHRPALLDVVDRIIVVDGGRVVADGPKAVVLAALAGQRPQAAAPDVTQERGGAA